MNYERDRAWAEVSLDRLADNYHKLSEFVGPSCKVLCVIKGNAYGHGAVEVSKELERAGCEILGAATIEEAMELREHGIKLPARTHQPGVRSACRRAGLYCPAN